MTFIRKVVCGMSGGVDSTVAAYLLKKRGYNVQGVFMRNWDKANEVGVCMADHELEDAQMVCDHIDVPLHQVNFVKEYWNNVFSPMIAAYEEGITPNVDVMCNRYIKFGTFFDYATRELGADFVATGHYARTSAEIGVTSHGNNCQLWKPVDIAKDQTLFLSQVPQAALQRTLFPIGHLRKTEVKKIAEDIGLPDIAKKKESMGICFIGAKNFYHFIQEYIEPKPGKFINLENGEVVGTHNGIHYWTVGQRCAIAGLPVAYFVLEIDVKTNNIIVVPGTYHPALYSTKLTVQNMHWIDIEPPSLYTPEGLQCHFRFQQLQKLIQCTVRPGITPGTLDIELEKPLRALTKGQTSVLYDGVQCLGGGVIVGVGTSLNELDNGRELLKDNEDMEMLDHGHADRR